MTKWFASVVAGAALLVCGCGKAERQEAVAFGKNLQQKSAEFAATNALEKDLVGSTRAWCEGITSGGAGKGNQLTENADSAAALAQSAGLISTQLGQLRQVLYDQLLKQEYTQTARGNLLQSLMTRQRKLQEIRQALDSSAADFRGFAQSRSYTGDSYPAGIERLTTLLKGYHPAEDLLKQAIADLKTKYKLTDAELGGGLT